MINFRHSLVILTGFLIQSSVFAADRLPRVLILGDSVYSQPARTAASILQGRVEVVYSQSGPADVRHTTAALAGLETLLGDGKWDLIHFNFGLADLVHRVPGMKSFRVLPKLSGGIRTTGPEHYASNLRKLVRRLRATGARLIWASTTPIRHSSSNIFEMGSEIEYNAIAARVMVENDVPINDMYSHVKSIIDMTKPASHGADPFYFDRQPLYPPIVRSILRELNLIRPVHGPVQVVVMAGGWSHIGGGIVIDPIRPRSGQPRGTLDELVLNKNTAPAYRHLLDDDGAWATRADVWIHFDRRGPRSGTLGIGYGGDRQRGIGSELALGHVLGNHFKEQVCIIKTTLGTPALANELRPPGSGQTGSSYTRLVQQVRASLGSLQDKFPDYTDEAGYEIAGLILNLGEQDQDPDLYAHYLPILIADLRKDLQVQELPVVIVGTGRGGRIQPDFPRILSAQRAVAALPQFAATVTWVDTRGFWPSEDARDASRHPSHERWYDNAESFYRMGNAAAQGLLKLLH